jgi:inner membrane protein
VVGFRNNKRGVVFMTKKTHLAIGTLVSLPVLTNPIGLIGILGAIAPDIDIKLGMSFHRTFTHSLFFLIFSSLGISIFSRQIALIWFISYASHLFLDSLTKAGVPLFYPIKGKYGLRLFTTGLLFDKLIGIFGLFMIGVYIISLIIG